MTTIVGVVHPLAPNPPRPTPPPPRPRETLVPLERTCYVPDHASFSGSVFSKTENKQKGWGIPCTFASMESTLQVAFAGRLFNVKGVKWNTSVKEIITKYSHYHKLLRSITTIKKQTYSV